MDATVPLPQALSHRERKSIVRILMLPVFMGSLDNTNLASALPTIGRAFGDAHSLPWLITAFLIASTSVIPLYGKFSDIHGRRVTLLIAIAVYIVGSLACALAPTMPTLIAARAVHGLGSGGLTAMGLVVLGDVAAPRDRGRYYVYYAAMYVSAGICGPALGGFIAEYLHWSVIFWANVPMGLIAALLTYRLLRRLPRLDCPHRLDIPGALLIMAASAAFMLALNMGGVRYPWTSPTIIALFGCALAGGVAFMVRMWTAPEPLIPLSILADRVARCAIVANAFGWGSIIGLNIFMPMYLQGVLGMTATAAGLSLMVLMAGVNLAGAIYGNIVARVQHYKALPMLTLVFAIGAVLTLAFKGEDISLLAFEALLAAIGFGFGALPPLCSISLQNAVEPYNFGAAIGTMNFSRNLFSTILIATLGAIIAAALPAGNVHLAEQLEGNWAGYSGVFQLTALTLTVALIFVALMPERALQTR